MNSSPIRKAEALIAFGANQGDREKAFQKSVELLKLNDEILEIRASSPVITKAVLGSGKNYGTNETNLSLDQCKPVRDANDAYLNAAIRILTTFSAEQLHKQLIEIEEKLGRQRSERWGSRTIDLDLLIFGDQKIRSPNLVVPHPRMSFRQFVLKPALEIAAEMVHPDSGMTILQLVHHLQNADPLICFATDDVGFARQLVANCPMETKIVEEINQFINIAPKARLVVSCFDPSTERTSDLESLERFATNFAGPMLRIDPGNGVQYARTELFAAVEAMGCEADFDSAPRNSAHTDKQV